MLEEDSVREEDDNRTLPVPSGWSVADASPLASVCGASPATECMSALRLLSRVSVGEGVGEAEGEQEVEGGGEGRGEAEEGNCGAPGSPLQV